MMCFFVIVSACGFFSKACNSKQSMIPPSSIPLSYLQRLDISFRQTLILNGIFEVGNGKSTSHDIGTALYYYYYTYELFHVTQYIIVYFTTPNEYSLLYILDDFWVLISQDSLRFMSVRLPIEKITCISNSVPYKAGKNSEIDEAECTYTTL